MQGLYTYYIQPKQQVRVLVGCFQPPGAIMLYAQMVQLAEHRVVVLLMHMLLRP